jgi:hypothetical protein
MVRRSATDSGKIVAAASKNTGHPSLKNRLYIHRSRKFGCSQRPFPKVVRVECSWFEGRIACYPASGFLRD